MGTHSRTMIILTDGNQIMRKLIILCLLVAIGAVAMIQRADAQDRLEYCRNHPTDTDCRNANGYATGIGPGNQITQPAPWQGQRHGGWNRQPHARDNGPDVGIYFGFSGSEPPPSYGYGSNYYPGQCRDVAFMLRDQGFENVCPVRCSGPRLIFTAWRDGERVTLYVTRDGRIRRIIPNY